METPPELFDRRLVRQRRNRAARLDPPLDYLARHVSGLLAERIGDVRRRFGLAVAIGCAPEPLEPARRRQIDHLIHLDPSEAAIRGRGAGGVVADEEVLPLADERFDLVIAAGSLHLVNDLPGALIQIRRALRPDGLLLGALPGGETLIELRESLLQAELEIRGGAGLRIAPFADVRDLGALLQRAGFALPVVDLETLRVTFDHPLRLLRELRQMGQGNPLSERSRQPLDRATLARTVEIYTRRFGTPDGRIPATFQFLMLSGWRPDPSQPVARRRGSGLLSLVRELGGSDDAPDDAPGTGTTKGRSP